MDLAVSIQIRLDYVDKIKPKIINKVVVLNVEQILMVVILPYKDSVLVRMVHVVSTVMVFKNLDLDQDYKKGRIKRFILN